MQAQTPAVVKAFIKEVPFSTSSSKFGVTAVLSPSALILRLMSSAIITRIFGLSSEKISREIITNKIVKTVLIRNYPIIRSINIHPRLKPINVQKSAFLSKFIFLLI